MRWKKDGTVDLRYLPKIVYRPLGRQVADGQATQLLHTEPNEKPPELALLEVDSRLTGRRRLETEVHEAFHLAAPWAPEGAVLKVSRYISMVLWDIGYRLSKE